MTDIGRAREAVAEATRTTPRTGVRAASHGRAIGPRLPGPADAPSTCMRDDRPPRRHNTPPYYACEMTAPRPIPHCVRWCTRADVRAPMRPWRAHKLSSTYAVLGRRFRRLARPYPRLGSRSPRQLIRTARVPPGPSSPSSPQRSPRPSPPAPTASHTWDSFLGTHRWRHGSAAWASSVAAAAWCLRAALASTAAAAASADPRAACRHSAAAAPTAVRPNRR